jgi:hypothetical protein
MGHLARPCNVPCAFYCLLLLLLVHPLLSILIRSSSFPSIRTM